MAASVPLIAPGRRGAGNPYLPPVEGVKPPPINTEVAVVYSNKGTYLGWIETEAMRKWCYTIYYPTNKAYKVERKKWIVAGNNHGMIVREVRTGLIALLFVEFTFTEADLVDPADVKQKAIATLNMLKDRVIQPGDPTGYVEDPFRLLTPVIDKAADKVRKAYQETEKKINAIEHKARVDRAALLADLQKGPCVTMKQELIDYLKSLIGAVDATKAGSEDAGVNLDV